MERIKSLQEMLQSRTSESKRKKQIVMRFDRIYQRAKENPSFKSGEKSSLRSGKGSPSTSGIKVSSKSGENSSSKKEGNCKSRIGKGKMVAKIGDLIYVEPEIFDADDAYSKQFPERVFGTVNSISQEGIANTTWVEDGWIFKRL